MKVLRTVAAVRDWRTAPTTAGGTVGLVPTMGALHDGHAALVDRAVRENDRAIASIFVNPTQFGPHEDYTAYPRSEAGDVALLAAHGASAVFIPSIEEMYPAGSILTVAPGEIAAPLEGAVRPGHFSGVATVVKRLFDIVTPDRAYFGQKDLQQLRVLQTMVRELGLSTRVIGCPIVRSAAGLALSSRNSYLDDAERVRAQALSAGLFAARDAFATGERDSDTLRRTVRSALDAASLDPDYVSCADPVTLRECSGRIERAALSCAATVGRARLIDNVLLGIRLQDLDEL